MVTEKAVYAVKLGQFRPKTPKYIRRGKGRRAKKKKTNRRRRTLALLARKLWAFMKSYKISKGAGRKKNFFKYER